MKHLRLRPWLLAAVAGGLLLALPLAWALRASIRELVVVPIAYLLWLIGNFFESLPQPIVWSMVVFGAVLAALRTLAGTVTGLPASKPLKNGGGQVSTWLRWIQLTRRGIYSKDGLARHVGDLVLAVLAYQQQRSLREMRLQLRHEPHAFPPLLATYMRAALGEESLHAPSQLAKLLPFRLRHPHPEVVAELDVLVTYLEASLEGATWPPAPEESP